MSNADDDRLPDPKTLAPIKAAPLAELTDGVPVAWHTSCTLWHTGCSACDGKNWIIQTDGIRKDELESYEFPDDARQDAETIVAIINAYRTGRLVEAKT